jgi:hypothetical protein
MEPCTARKHRHARAAVPSRGTSLLDGSSLFSTRPIAGRRCGPAPPRARSSRSASSAMPGAWTARPSGRSSRRCGPGSCGSRRLPGPALHRHPRRPAAGRWPHGGAARGGHPRRSASTGAHRSVPRSHARSGAQAPDRAGSSPTPPAARSSARARSRTRSRRPACARARRASRSRTAIKAALGLGAGSEADALLARSIVQSVDRPELALAAIRAAAYPRPGDVAPAAPHGEGVVPRPRRHPGRDPRSCGAGADAARRSCPRRGHHGASTRQPHPSTAPAKHAPRDSRADNLSVRSGARSRTREGREYHSISPRSPATQHLSRK